MKKKIILIGLIAFLMCGCGKVSKLENGKDAVVSFDGLEKISVDDLYDQIKDRYAISILIDMIDKEILYKTYEKDIKDADDYADKTVKSLKSNYDTEEELIQAINSYYGYSTIKEFKEYIKLNYLRDLATTDYAKKQVTDKQIEEYYENETVGDIEASHILITVDAKDGASEEEKEAKEKEAKELAEKIIKELDEGKDFSELAKKYSKDDANKNNGGALGKFNKGEMENSFEKAAYELKVGEYSKEPVKTTYGFHIIKKTKEHEKLELKEVKEKIVETLSQETLSKNATISITALTELRKENGMKIEDSELETNYNKYINSLYNYYMTTSSNN